VAGETRPALRIEMTSGMAFPEPESGIRPERVARAMLRAAGRARALPVPLPTKEALRYTLAQPPLGVSVVWVELRPRGLELKADVIEEYLHEIGASETVGPRWRARPEPKAWRETYRKHAKTFLRTGEAPAEDGDWRAPVGMQLELVPESDPTRLAAGSELSLRLLKDGRPLAGLPVAAERGAGRDRLRTFATSDGEGRVCFRLDRPGPWLVAATELREKGPEWDSDFTTLTLVVAPPAR
jgi:hypothetical protein